MWPIKAEGELNLKKKKKSRVSTLQGGAVAEWVRALAWAGDRTVSRPGSNPATVTSLRNFGNSVYPALPVSFGGDTKSRRSLLSGVYARGSKRSHQSALECVTVVDSTTHSKKKTPRPPECDYAAENAALHLYRKKKKKRLASDIWQWYPMTDRDKLK